MARTPWAEYERAVRVYTEAGAAETVQRIVTALSRLSRRLDVFYNQRFDALDMSRSDWPVLQALAVEGRDGHSNPSKLADAAGVSASTMTHRLDLLEQRGLVQRAPDPTNRTRTVVSLTPAGWERFRAAVLDAETEETGVFAPLTEDERSTLATLLEKALAGSEASDGAGGGVRRAGRRAGRR
jgi:DNA-binding MarR family transcriptional regulator